MTQQPLTFEEFCEKYYKDETSPVEKVMLYEDYVIEWEKLRGRRDEQRTQS